MYKNDTIDTILEVIKNANDIVISGHVGPDADSIGGCLALAHFLNEIGKTPKVLIEEYNTKFKILPGFNYVYTEHIDKLTPDLFICLDCGDINRLGDRLNLFEKTKNTIVIDHHISNNYFGKYNYINISSSSTCELIYEVLENANALNANIASCLYAGILSDTGGFRYKSTSPYTLEIVSNLLKYNIPFNNIYDEIMYARSLNEAKAYIYILNKFKVLNDAPIAYTSITLEELNDLGVTPKDLEGIGEFLMRIRGIEVSIFAYEKLKNETKISLRSREKDVNKIASYFNGGGHKNASGCLIKEDASTAINIVLEKIRNEFN